MANGMVDNPEKEPAPLSNEGINQTVTETAKKVGRGFIKGLVDLTKSQAQKDAEAADAAKQEEIKKNAPAQVY